MLAAYDELPADITELYRAALATIGQSVRVELPGSAVDRPGARRARRTAGWWCSTTAAITHRFDTGDVVHLRVTTARRSANG